MIKTCQNFINGKWTPPSSGKYYEIRNPADKDEIIGQFPLSEIQDVDQAVLAASKAFLAWSKLLPMERAAYVEKFTTLLDEKTNYLGECLCREQGKPLVEAIGEPSRGVKECKYVIGEATRLQGLSLPSERQGVTNTVVREPVGVIAAITPWNFPMLTPLRKTIPALIAGCTVVLKPSYDTPWCSVLLLELFEKAGFPAGTVNLIMGRGSQIGDALSGNPLVRGITFTGSTIIGRQINKTAAANFAKVQLEMGGKNPAIVWDYANITGAAKSIAVAAFANAGQRCTAVSRVLVKRSQAEELEKALIAIIKEYKVGPGLEKENTIGPVVNKKAGDSIMEYIAKAREQGATIAIGGNQLKGGVYDKGYYIESTLVTNVTPDMAVAREEIFGPVLTVQKVDSFDEALEVANSSEYGLASCIFTDTQANIYRFMKESQSGMVHINHGSVSESFMPFGGIKMSGLGPFSIGATNKDFFMNTKVIYNQYI
ncbi:MAG: aldehyde dehydrogenase family protein [Treponema sp.]|jgi:aldehyde dehydrogenase (NAD+)|nr:aldehyde dehydrogenase family protein [Treponema sp.]